MDSIFLRHPRNARAICKALYHLRPVCVGDESEENANENTKIRNKISIKESEKKKGEKRLVLEKEALELKKN